jgi:hypothetical protein
MSTKKLFLSGCALAAACHFHGAHAFEGGVSAYPAGAVGTNIASMPPIPGLFMLQQFNYSYANGLYGNNGEKLPVPFKSSVYSATTRLLAAYPGEVFGAHVFSQLVVPVVSLHTTVAGQSSTQNGLSNITVSPVILSWKVAPEIDVTTGLDLAFATGSYSPYKPSVAVGYFSLQPVIAFRYNKPDGLDVGLANRFLLNSKNHENQYSSGDGYIGEFAAGWNFGRWKVGVVGAYMNQFSDDKINGVTVGSGNRARSFGIGPSVVYDGGPFHINLNFQQGVYAANTVKSSSVWLNIALPLAIF